MERDSESILLLAGDIDIKRRGIDYANLLSERFKAVVLVPGNHDLWGSNFSSLQNSWVEEANENVHPLFNSSVVIDNVSFSGGTLWTGYKDNDEFVMWNATRAMNDYRKIRYGDSFRKFSPAIALYEHRDCLRAIREALSSTKTKHVVLTHMSPSYSLGEACYIGGEMEHYYHSNLDDLLVEADLWCYGHNHYNVDRVVGNKPTRLISNQRGYSPNDLCSGFREDLLIEI
jgi:predicted phosphohydrolase